MFVAISQIHHKIFFEISTIRYLAYYLYTIQFSESLALPLRAMNRNKYSSLAGGNMTFSLITENP